MNEIVPFWRKVLPILTGRANAQEPPQEEPSVPSLPDPALLLSVITDPEIRALARTAFQDLGNGIFDAMDRYLTEKPPVMMRYAAVVTHEEICARLDLAVEGYKIPFDTDIPLWLIDASGLKKKFRCGESRYAVFPAESEVKVIEREEVPIISYYRDGPETQVRNRGFERDGVKRFSPDGACYEGFYMELPSVPMGGGIYARGFAPYEPEEQNDKPWKLLGRQAAYERRLAGVLADFCLSEPAEKVRQNLTMVNAFNKRLIAVLGQNLDLKALTSDALELDTPSSLPGKDAHPFILG